ncbi:metacaspase-1-like [Zingiber officinale]|uniref:metacaspase-1-like n=1 Tax=Zingiber officinale TaxID=94328 RepID=UPI001C4BBD1E|nr:metacaspase-1-like [Zingiber officinale]
MSMCRRRKETVRCSDCGRLLEVPPHVQSICCAVCLAITGVRDYQDPVGQAVGFLSRPTAGQLPSSFPGVHGKKRALLVGISYAGQRCELKRTVNDVNCVRYLLTEKFGYPAPCIVVLTDEEIDPQRIPTKEKLRAAMQWLVQGCKAGDSLVFPFSGHGVQKLDPSGDEGSVRSAPAKLLHSPEIGGRSSRR